MIFSEIEVIDGEQYVKIEMLENEVSKNKILQQRIDKAIKYINTHYLEPNDTKLIIILKGEDK